MGYTELFGLKNLAGPNYSCADMRRAPARNTEKILRHLSDEDLRRVRSFLGLKVAGSSEPTNSGEFNLRRKRDNPRRPGKSRAPAQA
jgi:hypothetical protein